MRRRGFLGFLGGAVAAGPAMAKQAAQSVNLTGLQAMAIPSIPYPEPVEEFSSSATGLVGGDYDHGQWLRERLAEVTGLSGQERRDRIASMHVTQLDPDLAVNRSMALWAKVNEQRQRNYERSRDHEVRHLTKDLGNWLKQQALS